MYVSWMKMWRAKLERGVNRGMGAIAGGSIGCLSALLALQVGVVGNPIIISTSVFIFGKYYICTFI